MNDHTFDEKDASDWINIVESPGARIRETDIYPLLKEWINSIAPSTILEIGAGQGICSEYIDLDNRTYTGVEPSPFLLARAKQLYPQTNRHFLHGSAYHLPFSTSAFDAAFSVAVWHLLDDLHKASGELNRVLKRDGRFLIITANPAAYSAWTDAYTETTLKGRRFLGSVRRPDNSIAQDTLYLHTVEEITEALTSSHCALERIETFRNVNASGGPGKFLLLTGTNSNFSRPR